MFKRIIGFFAITLVTWLEYGCATRTHDLCPAEKRQAGHACPQLVSTVGVGVVIGQKHLTIGWMRELYLDIPDPNDCRLIVVAEDGADLTKLAGVLGIASNDLSNICVVSNREVH